MLFNFTITSYFFGIKIVKSLKIMASKHFIIYYKKGTGTYVITEPRPWARENRTLFPDYDFVNNHPRTEDVENYLIQTHSFNKLSFPNEKIIVLQNLDPNLNL